MDTTHSRHVHRRHVHPHERRPRFARRLAAALLLMALHGAAAASSCTDEQVSADWSALMAALQSRLGAEQQARGAAGTLRKDKVGHVLVARPARAAAGETPAASSTASLSSDMQALGRTLQQRPQAFCEEARRVRNKHGV